METVFWRESGPAKDKLNIKFITDDKGRIISIMIYVDTSDDAEKIAEIICSGSGNNKKCDLGQSLRILNILVVNPSEPLISSSSIPMFLLRLL